MIKSLIIAANPASGLFDERNIHVPFDLFSMQSQINKDTSRKSFDIKCNDSQGTQKMTKKWEEPSF